MACKKSAPKVPKSSLFGVPACPRVSPQKMVGLIVVVIVGSIAIGWAGFTKSGGPRFPDNFLK